MNRLLTTGLSILLLSTLVIPGAKAESQNEQPLQITQPAQTNGQTSGQTSGRTTVPKDSANGTNREDGYRQAVNQGNDVERQSGKLSERDRIIRQYQTQTVIPER